jgi:cell division protein FtsA
LISARLSCIQSLSRAINQAGYEVKDLFFSGMATQRAVSNPEFNEETNILCDIGSDIIEILIFKDGILSHLEILSFGGNDLTQQLAEALKIPFELAEEVKKSYASVGDYSRLKEEKEILIKKSSIYAPIKHKLVVEVVTAGARLISQKIKDAIEKFGPSSAVNNFIATGRTVLLEGFLETLEDILRVPVKLGRFTEQQIIPFVTKDSAWSGQKYLVYLTCAGIILEAMHEQRPKILSFKHPAANPVLKAVTKFKEIYQEYF